ncbi:MAG: hypothetical protein KF681_03790 [Bdellovibrionaceae bacterium]|nr:hypothetical protein [Pseudobdellovibrionaceae bacterium]
MKKMILTLAAVSAFATSAAWAQSDDGFQSAEQYASEQQVFELEPGAMSAQDVQALQTSEAATSGNTTYGRGDDLARGIIGGIIGVIADQYDRGHRDRGYRGQVTCFAQNRRGETFRAVGNRARPAQQAALNKCYRVSRDCRPAGCR